MLEEGEATDPGAAVESGVVRDVVYVGMVTRYVVDLDVGGELVVVRQNLNTSAEALEAQGRRVTLAWQPSQTVAVSSTGEKDPEAEEEEEVR